MATDKTFSVAGISSLNGEYKVRFANDMMRIKVLDKSGHEDIRLYPLDTAVTKLEAARQLLTVADFSDAVAQATITEYIEDNSLKAKVSKPVAKAPAKATKTPVAKTAKAPAKAVQKVTEDEDAPF